MYPEVSIKHSWANEDLWQGCGSQTYLGGEMVDYDYPETEKDNLEVGASIWGYDLEEYDLKLSASGNTYVNLSNEVYDLIAVDGHPALFSNGKMNLDDIPNGLFLYHLRSSDDGEQFCTLETKVGVNHGGSIITSEPLELGEKGYIQFNENNSPNFIGEQISFAQFMEGDFETKEAVDIEQN